MPTPEGWGPPAEWEPPPWLIYTPGGGSTWMEQTGIGADGVDYSGTEVPGEFTRSAYGSWETTTVFIPAAAPEEPEEPEEPAEVPELARRVAKFLGVPDDPDVLAQAAEQSAVVTELARAYTRGGGFIPAPGLTEVEDDIVRTYRPRSDVAAVIVTATARLVANPEQIGRGIGDVQYRGGFDGWSLAERAVLNRYRRKAA